MTFANLIDLTGFGPGRVSYGAEFFNSKTTRLMVGACLGSIAGGLQGGLTWKESVVGAVGSLAIAFIKDAMVKATVAGATKVELYADPGEKFGVGEGGGEVDAGLAEVHALVDEALGNALPVRIEGSASPASTGEPGLPTQSGDTTETSSGANEREVGGGDGPDE